MPPLFPPFHRRPAYRFWVGLVVLALALSWPLAARAQEAGPSVVITGVDSGNFPTITAYLTVSGANGLPLVGLTADNFTVKEDGRSVSARTITLASDTSQQLSLVLAVDVSVNEADLANVQAATIDFVNSLGPNDQVALVTYFDAVTTTVPFTTDKTQLVTALQSLTADGTAPPSTPPAAERQPAGRARRAQGRAHFTNSGDTTETWPPSPCSTPPRRPRCASTRCRSAPTSIKS
jgi:hypothetical protein